MILKHPKFLLVTKYQILLIALSLVANILKGRKLQKAHFRGEVIDVLIILIVVTVSCVYTYVKSHQIVHFKYV